MFYRRGGDVTAALDSKCTVALTHRRVWATDTSIGQFNRLQQELQQQQQCLAFIVDDANYPSPGSRPTRTPHATPASRSQCKYCDCAPFDT